ncbi:MAG: hypothetical protein ACLGIR_01510 [Actinomycetes bacterium]
MKPHTNGNDSTPAKRGPGRPPSAPKTIQEELARYPAGLVDRMWAAYERVDRADQEFAAAHEEKDAVLFEMVQHTSQRAVARIAPATRVAILQAVNRHVERQLQRCADNLG